MKTIKKNIFISWQGKDLPRVIIWNIQNISGTVFDGFKKIGTVWADPVSEPEAFEERFRFRSVKHKKTFLEEGRGMKSLFSAIRDSYMAAVSEYERKHGKYAGILSQDFRF